MDDTSLYADASPVISPESDELLRKLITEELQRRSPGKLLALALALAEYYDRLLQDNGSGNDNRVRDNQAGDSRNAADQRSTYEQLVSEIAQTSEVTSNESGNFDQEQAYLQDWQDSGGRRLTAEEIAEMDTEFANDGGAAIDPEFQGIGDPFRRVEDGELDDIVERMDRELAEFDRLFGLDNPDGAPNPVPVEDPPEQPVADAIRNGVFDPILGPLNIDPNAEAAEANLDNPFGFDDQIGSVVPDPFSNDINNSGNVSMMMGGGGNPNPFPMNQNFGATNVFVRQNVVDPSVFNFNGSDPFSVPGFNVDNLSGFVRCPTFSNLGGPSFLNVTGYFNSSGTFMSGGHNNVSGSVRNVTITDGTNQFCTGGTGGANAMIVP